MDLEEKLQDTLTDEEAILALKADADAENQITDYQNQSKIKKFYGMSDKWSCP
jgi:hypothetical protein